MAVQIQQSNNPSFSLADIAQRRAQIDNQEQALSLRELAIGNQQEQLDRRADQTDDRNAIFERQLDQRIAEFETRSDAEKQKVQGQALSQIIESSDSPESALQKARIIGPKLGISPEEVESIGRLDPRVFTDPRAKAQFQKGIAPDPGAGRVAGIGDADNPGAGGHSLSQGLRVHGQVLLRCRDVLRPCR